MNGISGKVSMPVLRPEKAVLPPGSQDSVSYYGATMPIIQLKELEVDQLRYDQWKRSCERARLKREGLR